MRFLANENMPADAVRAIADDGHDVVWVRTAAPGSKDQDILTWAVREQRILLTFDQDFGELAWREGLPASCGIVLFRLSLRGPEKIGTEIAARIAARKDWAGHFSVVEAGRVRMRPMAHRKP